MSLEKLRSEISDIDSRIVKLLFKRMELSHRIGVHKKLNGLSIRDTSRELEILEKVCDPAPPDQKEYIKRIYEKIMEVSREYQADIMGEE